jgi:hypothetical protein
MTRTSRNGKRIGRPPKPSYPTMGGVAEYVKDGKTYIDDGVNVTEVTPIEQEGVKLGLVGTEDHTTCRTKPYDNGADAGMFCFDPQVKYNRHATSKTDVKPDDTQLKAFLKAIYRDGLDGRHRDLKTDVEALRRLV